MKNHFFTLLTMIILSTCNSPSDSSITQQPTLADYQVGETWIWKYKGVTTDGEVRSDGTDKRMIVQMNNGLGMTIGNDTIPLTEIVKPDESETPKYDWPLEVGKKWKYESESWLDPDSDAGPDFPLWCCMNERSLWVECQWHSKGVNRIAGGRLKLSR